MQLLELKINRNCTEVKRVGESVRGNVETLTQCARGHSGVCARQKEKDRDGESWLDF